MSYPAARRHHSPSCPSLDGAEPRATQASLNLSLLFFLTPSSGSSSSSGVSAAHDTALTPGVQTRAQPHICLTPLFYYRGSGQAVDAGMPNSSFSFAAAHTGGFLPARLPRLARCVANHCHKAQGRTSSSWCEDGHELWICQPPWRAEGTSCHRDDAFCSTDLTETQHWTS